MSFDCQARILVMFRCFFELCQKYVRISQITIGSSFGRFIAELARNTQSLLMVFDRRFKITKQIVCVAQIAAGTSLRTTIAQFFHQTQILLVEFDCFQQWIFDLFAKVARIRLPNVLSLCVIHIAEVIQRPSFRQSIAQLSGKRQMAFATNCRFIESAHHFQRISQIARRFRLAQFIVHRLGQRQIQIVVLHRFRIIAKIEVCIAQLTVYGT